MFRTALATAAGLTSLASATPLAARQIVPNYPPNELSKGFRLVANVTDPSTDLSPSVHGQELLGIHIGAGLNEAVLTAQEGDGYVFYHNGTAAEVRAVQGSIISDSGNPPFPLGLTVQGEDEFDSAYPKEHFVHINGGAGTTGVSLLMQPDPYFYVTNFAQGTGTFVACPRKVPYYDSDFIVVRFAYDVWDSENAVSVQDVPENCTAITLIPECDLLSELPEGSLSSHAEARDSKCYVDVSAINWPEYGP
ncbi:hypothetical protein F4808DRAFT_463142 [Astrocystis sublimbata]|nr:hypothetical protein F4808DRAFT_463142 [Astrocystis sublimbata]